VRAEHNTARELGGQLLALADIQQDSALLLQAHLALGYSLYPLGEFRAASAHLKEARDIYDSRRHHALAFTYGSFDPGVAGLCYEAMSSWVVGYPDMALKKIQQAQTLANDLSHAFSVAAASNFSAMLHHYRREEDAVGEHANVVISLCTEQGFPFYLAWGTIFRGWALYKQGDLLEGARQLREGLAAWRATGAELWWSHFLALSAELNGQEGQPEEGLSSLNEALVFIERTGERHYAAELYRLKGELLLQLPGHTLAEVIECFQQAIEIAHSQQAKSWELRAAVSLARLWQQQGKQVEARTLLSEIYNWFTEGFDTKDMQDAKALLQELA
jgi:predicted ATPase